MTPLATRIADARKKAEATKDARENDDTWFTELALLEDPIHGREAAFIIAASPSLFIEMADEIARLKAQLEKAREAIRHAYNEGFSEGMREHTSRRGGKTWAESTAARVYAELAEKEKE